MRVLCLLMQAGTLAEHRFVNTGPTGAVTISGTTTQGETLTADTTDLDDLDGLGSLSYQWLRDGVAIAGATMIAAIRLSRMM